MPAVDDFFRLKEYDSLGREAQALQGKMDEERSRLQRRAEELAARQAQLAERETAQRELGHQIAELERRLTQRLSPQANAQLEEEGLALLSRQDEIAAQIGEHRTFIQGFTRTIQELQGEIDAQLTAWQAERAALLERARRLIPELPEGWHEAYQRVAQKKPAHGVFTRLAGLHCQFCRHAVSKVLQSEVDVGLMLKGCPGCSRLILPYKAVAG